MDVNVFREQMQQMGSARPRFALFLSQDDRALNGIALDHWLRTASQLGICTLKIFERIHHARFADLKVSSRIAELTQGL